MNVRRRSSRGGRRRDDGAAAVEFALVSPLLFLMVFGVLQYGFGLYELQAAQSTVTNVARQASQGFACGGATDSIVDLTKAAASGNGFRPRQSQANDLQVRVQVTPTTPTNTVAGPNDAVTVTLSYVPRIRLFFVPFPDRINRSATTTMGSLNTTTTTSVPLTCPDSDPTHFSNVQL